MRLLTSVCMCLAGGAGNGAAGEDADDPTAWPDALVDVLLALLSKRTVPLPSALLREAVEGAFRAMADSVTATGQLGEGRSGSSEPCVWTTVHQSLQITNLVSQS